MHHSLSLSLSHTHTHTHTHTHAYTYALASLIICKYTNIFCRCTRRRNTQKSMICPKVIEYIIVVAAAGDDCSVGDIIVRDAATTTQECVILFFSPLGNCLLLLLGCSGRREL